MRRIFLSIVSLAILIFISSCSVKETADINAVENKESVSITPTSTKSLVIVDGESEIILTKEEKENLGILIKWIYNSVLIHNGDDDSSLQLPDNINLLPTDQDKIDFIIALATYENLIKLDHADSLSYSFTADYADLIINYALGKKISKHQAYEDIDYDDGTYYYSLAGADGAMWWPSIEIQSAASVIKDKIKIKGILRSEHDIFANVYSYNFEAIAIVNSESPFGGYTLEELYIR